MVSKAYLFFVLALCSRAAFCAPRHEKLTFIKNGQVYTSSADGTDIRQLSKGQSERRMPKWSPDGTKVVYEEAVINNKSIGDLVVTDTNGLTVGRYPIATVTDSGVQIAGMQYIQGVGWFDRQHVFALGEVNPYVVEYIAIDIYSRKIKGFGGFGFATCSNFGRLAYWLPVFPQSEVMTLRTSLDAKPLFEFPDKRALPTIHIPIAWDMRCESVAFIDPRSPMHFVVISAGRRHSDVLLLQEQPALTVTTVPQGFLIGAGGRLLYETNKARLVDTPKDMLAAIKAEGDRRTRIENTLGAQEADWWPPNGASLKSRQ